MYSMLAGARGLCKRSDAATRAARCRPSVSLSGHDRCSALRHRTNRVQFCPGSSAARLNEHFYRHCEDRFPMRIAYALMLLVIASARAAPVDPKEVPKDAVAYRVSVCARPFPDSGLGIPAHAFLALNTVDPAQKRVFHAIGAVKGTQPRALVGHASMLTPVPDALSTNDYASLIQNCL